LDEIRLLQSGTPAAILLSGVLLFDAQVAGEASRLAAPLNGG